ncbi:hypothetical protein ABZX38_36160 [Streptomyces longwoodensis]|uniref:hypothetical protein n=1 Tax=Streptomyces longwoodensis TaxID=68231 RepID=UPI0033AA2910
MNRELEKFIRVYLSLEQAYDTSGYLRPTLHAFKDEYVRAVKDGLESVLRNRDLSIEEYERLTDIEFEDTDSLFNYLNGIYEYLFRGAESQPVPPN